MREAIVLLLHIGLAALGGAQAGAQQRVAHYQFRVWQFLPDSSRTSPGTLSGVASEDEDFHMFITLGSSSPPLAPDVRLDGDFVVHQWNDSTLFIGDVTAQRVVSRDSTKLFARDLVGEDRVERRTYRLRATSARDRSVWFYPFGVPRRGERGVAFELAVSTAQPGDTAGKRPERYRPPRGFVPMSYGIDALNRAHSARVRVEVGDREFANVFEGEALTRVPVRIRVQGGARGQDLMFELETEEQGKACWRWYWADERPPGGAGCWRVPDQAEVASLDGTKGLKLRVTRLWP